MVKNIVEKELQLLSINGTTELATGDYIVRLDFGELIENTPDTANRLQASAGSNPIGMKKVPTNTVFIFLTLEHASSFKVGTKWKLMIGQDSKITLESVK